MVISVVIAKDAFTEIVSYVEMSTGVSGSRIVVSTWLHSFCCRATHTYIDFTTTRRRIREAVELRVHLVVVGE